MTVGSSHFLSRVQLKLSVMVVVVFNSGQSRRTGRKPATPPRLRSRRRVALHGRGDPRWLDGRAHRPRWHNATRRGLERAKLLR
jgi:hypothetical protein